jgi:predicted nucleic acid-binding protein
MIKTYLDSGVLLAAWRSVDDSKAELAISVMEDRERIFYTSQLARLELLPKAIYFKQQAESEFYRTHFEAAAGETSLSREIGLQSEKFAAKYGLAAMDALHLTAAINQGAEEFITTEKPDKPMFKVKEIKVRTLNSIRV